MRALVVSLLAVSLAACAARRIPEEDIVEGLPPWQTKGEEVRLRIAETFLETDNTFSALQIIRQMRQEGFDSGELDLLQGRAMRIDGVVTEAGRLLESAREKMPRDARPYVELCVLKADEGEVEQAIELCQRATELDDGDARAWNNLSFLLLTTDRYEEAGAAAEQAVRLDGAEPLFRNNLALTQVALGRAELAYRTFHSTMPKPDAAFNVGVAVERFEDDFEGARAWYLRALQANPKHLKAREKLAPEESPENPSEGAEQAPVEEP